MNEIKSPYATFETDENLETAGRWIDYGSAGEYMIKRAGGANKRYSKVLTAKMKPYRRQIEAGTMDNDVAKKILVETFVDEVLLKWKNVNDRKGQPMEFNRENAITLFTDLPALLDDLQKQAMNFAVFRRHEVEQDMGK